MKAKALKIVKYIWNEIKVPLAIFVILFLAGFGFYRGFVCSHLIEVMHGGKVILIHSVDLSGNQDTK